MHSSKRVRTMINAWIGGHGEGREKMWGGEKKKRAKLKRDWEGVMQRGNKYERKLFLNRSTMVAAEMSDVLLVEGKGTAYIWSASLLLLSVFSTRGREGVSGVIPNNNLPLFDRENANSQTFDQYTQTASWHLFKIALYGAVGLSLIPWGMCLFVFIDVVAQTPDRQVGHAHWTMHSQQSSRGNIEAGCSLGLTLKSLREEATCSKLTRGRLRSKLFILCLPIILPGLQQEVYVIFALENRP